MILHYIIVPASVIAQWFLKCKTLHIFDHTCCSPMNLVDCIYYTLLFHIRDLLEENITCQIQQPEKPCPQLQPAARLRLYSQQAHTQSTHTHHIYTHTGHTEHRQTLGALTRTQTGPMASSCSPLLLRMEVH